MTIFHYTEASIGLPNSGRLSGTDGDLVGILDVALVAAGWSIAFTSGNARGYRPATGNRFYFHFNDAAASSGDARLCIFRMAESMSGATTLTDPFPQVAQIADGSSNVLKSSTVNTTARNFDLFIGATWFMLFVNFSSTTNVWDFVAGGDISPTLSGDAYNSLCIVRNTTSATTVGNGWSTAINTTTGVLGARWARSFDATTKSTCGGIPQIGSGQLGLLTNAPLPQAGPSAGIDQEKTRVMDTGNNAATSMSSTLGLPCRGYFPNLWIPQHAGRGTVNTRDIWTNTTYNPSASFMAFTVGNAAGNAMIVVETTDTWSPPSG